MVISFPLKKKKDTNLIVYPELDGKLRDVVVVGNVVYARYEGGLPPNASELGISVADSHPLDPKPPVDVSKLEAAGETGKALKLILKRLGVIE